MARTIVTIHKWKNVAFSFIPRDSLVRKLFHNNLQTRSKLATTANLERGLFPIHHNAFSGLRKTNKQSMMKPAMAKLLMLLLNLFRRPYKYPRSANPFSEHDLGFNTPSEASNHAFLAQVTGADIFMPSCPSMKRGIIYARVNGSEKRKITRDLRKQVEVLRGQMKRDGVEEVEEPIKDVASGRNFKRVGLKRLLKLACARRIDCVYVSGLDRFGRRFIEPIRFLYLLRLQGVVIKCVEEVHA